MSDASSEQLLEAAKKVREHAYAPHSHFKVGAALRTRAGNVYLGCNVENASFGATTCAERNAIAAMVAAGEREVEAIAVYAGGETPTFPCGICRQVIYEFSGDARVIVTDNDAVREVEISDLLPEASASANLSRTNAQAVVPSCLSIMASTLPSAACNASRS
jgi:cytidine deaminase